MVTYEVPIDCSYNTSKTKCQDKTVSNIIRQDVQSHAIHVANNSFQKQGSVRITSAYVDDPLLQNSPKFSCSDVAFPWEQGWGQRYNNLESTLYGQTYIDMYKHIIVSMFEEGNKDPSKKMNPAMMQEQLRKQFLNVFSLMGETDIKKLINALILSKLLKEVLNLIKSILLKWSRFLLLCGAV